MENQKPVSQWKREVTPILQSKVEEFQMMGYSNATQEDLWACLVKKVWKGDPSKRLYEVAQDIFHLSNNTYVSYLTVESYGNDDLMVSIEALSVHNK